jgi:ribonuclease HI
MAVRIDTQFTEVGEMKSASDIQTLNIWTDGSVMDNSTGIGYELRARGTTVSKGYNKLTQCEDSAQAELHAIIEALEEAHRYPSVCSIHVHTDFDTIPKLLEGHSSPRENDIEKLVAKAKTLYNKFDHQSIQHTPRNNNTSAHDLAGKGHRLSLNEGPKIRRELQLSD